MSELLWFVLQVQAMLERCEACRAAYAVQERRGWFEAWQGSTLRWHLWA